MKKMKLTLEDLKNTNVPFRYSKQKYPSIVLNNSIDYPKIVVYAVSTYNMLVSNLENWQVNPNCFNMGRSITHSSYDSVHSNSIFTGYISEEAVKKKREDSKYSLTKEHCFTPQFMIKMVLDNHEKYLADPNKFFELYYECCQTREVTNEENIKLSQCVKTGKVVNGKKYNNVQILTPLSQRYNYCGIKILKRENGRGWYNKDMIEVDATLKTPEGYDEYESQFLVKKFE
jgi:hypothetical protein